MKNLISKTKFYFIAAFLSVAVLFLWLGLYLGSQIQPRSALLLNKCESNCWSANEVAALVSSIGIELNVQKVVVLKENDRCFSIQMVKSAERIHYVMIPKKDTKDLGDIDFNNFSSVEDCLKIAQEHIQEESLTKYVFTTNGPDYQHVRYLHFHLKSFK